MSEGKVITNEQHDGDQGEKLASYLVGQMGHEWHFAGRNEAGLDGFIELRHVDTRRVDAQIVLCQVKTGESYICDETSDAFSWRPAPGDLSYWENANAPVILMVMRLATEEAWWIAIDTAFPDVETRARGVIRFDKRRDVVRGTPNEALWEVARRERQRRAAATQMILAGPYAAVGLRDSYEEAQRALNEGRWADAVERWGEVAAAARSKRLDVRLVWPAEEQRARALESGGRRPAAGEIWACLAAERVEEDDPQAEFDLSRAMFYGQSVEDFDIALTYARARLPEAGAEGLEDLRAVYRLAGNAGQKRSAAAALVDALMFFGHYVEAERRATSVVRKQHNTSEKRQLAMDRLDALAELGNDVDEAWNELVDSLSSAGPDVYGVALQRRAVAYLRAGDRDLARARFRDAAEIWERREGGDEQVAEAAFSLESVDNLSGGLGPERMPPGARQAAALARGDVRTSAARSDRLVTAGLGFLADKRRPDALQRLTLAAMVDRRSGNLFSYRRSAYLLARAYEDADEWAEALRFWLMVGSERQAAVVAAKLDIAAVLEMARFGAGPPWERAASLAALVECAGNLDAQSVSRIEEAAIEAARPGYGIAAPQPSYHARRLLSRICDRVSGHVAEDVGEILAEDVRLGTYLAREASQGLVELERRGVFDAIPVILDAILAGQDLPVHVRGWLRDAPKRMQRPVVKAAIAGNAIALQEAAGADLPKTFEELRSPCIDAVKAAVKSEDRPGESFGVSFVHLADLARFCTPRLQGQFVDMLLRVVSGTAYDDGSKVSALITMAITAPGMALTPARRALKVLLPIAGGAPIVSAPAEHRDHPNPKRARTSMTFTTPSSGVRAGALQAVARLALRTESRPQMMAAVFRDALSEDDVELTRMALGGLIVLPELLPDVDGSEWLASVDRRVRDAANALQEARLEGRSA